MKKFGRNYLDDSMTFEGESSYLPEEDDTEKIDIYSNKTKKISIYEQEDEDADYADIQNTEDFEDLEDEDLEDEDLEDEDSHNIKKPKKDKDPLLDEENYDDDFFDEDEEIPFFDEDEDTEYSRT